MFLSIVMVEWQQNVRTNTSKKVIQPEMYWNLVVSIVQCFTYSAVAYVVLFTAEFDIDMFNSATSNAYNFHESR